MSTLFVRTKTVADGTKRYAVVYRRGGRYHPVEQAGTFKTRKEATARRDLVAGMLAAGLNPKVELARRTQPGRDIEDVALEYFATKRGWSDGTRDGHRFRLPVITGAFGRVDEITTDDVIAWVGELEAEYAPGTIRVFVQELRQILDHADLPANPARNKRVELPPEPPKTLEPPTAPEILSVLNRAADDLVLPLIVMEQLGTRVGETMQVGPGDVGEGRVRLRVETVKGKRTSRWVPASDLLTGALLERLPFTRSRHIPGKELRRLNAGFTPHDLRHRRASLWSAQGVPPAQAAAWLGHTVPVYLRTYTHVVVDEEIAPQDLASLLR